MFFSSFFCYAAIVDVANPLQYDLIYYPIPEDDLQASVSIVRMCICSCIVQVVIDGVLNACTMSRRPEPGPYLGCGPGNKDPPPPPGLRPGHVYVCVHAVLCFCVIIILSTHLGLLVCQHGHLSEYRKHKSHTYHCSAPLT